MEEEEQRNSGESEAKHKAQEPPFAPPQTSTLCPLITHTGTKESTFHGFSHGTGRREGQAGGTEGWRRGGRKDGGLALKQASGHHHRGAIVLHLPHPVLMRAPEGGGAGRYSNRKVGGAGLGGGD